MAKLIVNVVVDNISVIVLDKLVDQLFFFFFFLDVDLSSTVTIPVSVAVAVPVAKPDKHTDSNSIADSVSGGVHQLQRLQLHHGAG